MSIFRKLWLVLLVGSAAGCTHFSTPPDPTQTPSSLNGYFWQAKDTSYSYITDGNARETVSIAANGNLLTVTDHDPSGDASFIDTSNGGNETVSMLSSHTLFRFPDYCMTVSDMHVQDTSYRLNATAIVSAGPGPNDSIYLATDRGFYVFDTTSQRFTYRGNIGSNSIFTFAFNGYASPKGTLYAASRTDGIFQSTDLGFTWSAVPYAPTKNISTMTVGPIGFNLFGLFAASGGQIYLWNGAKWISAASALKDNIVSMVVASGGHSSTRLMVLTSTGQVVRYNPSSLQFRDSSIANSGAMITCLGTTNGKVYGGTATGLLGMEDASGDHWDVIDKIAAGASIASISNTGGLCFVASAAGDVWVIFDDNGLPLQKLPSAPSQIAWIYQAENFALIGGQMYYSHSDIGMWGPVDQVMGKGRKWPAGGFTLLQGSGGQWNAGFVEDTIGLANTPRGYEYRANVDQYAPSIMLDSVRYINPVIIVSYKPYVGTAEDNGSNRMPDFQVYYEQGVGPIRIVRNLNGNRTITRLVP